MPPRVSNVPTPTDAYAVWRDPNYRHFEAGWFLLTFASFVETLCARAYLYDATGDAMALGWIGLVRAVPVILLAIPGGQLADRFSRKHVMLSTMVLSALLSLGLIGAVSSAAPVGWIYLLLGLGGVSHALGTPSRLALLPQLVASDLFGNAVAWNSSVFQIAAVTGPTVGGLVMARGSVTAAFILVFVCRLVSLATIAGLKTPRAAPNTESLSWESLVAGFRFVGRTKLILATITLDLFAVLLGGAVYLLPVFAKDILGVGKLGLGVLQSADACGAVAMAVLLTHRPPLRRAGRTLLWAVAGFGLATIVFGLSRWYWLSLAMMFLIGAFDSISVIVRHTLVQMLTPDSMRGRVSAVNNIFIVASNDLGGAESGVAARLLGPVWAVVVGGIGSIAVVFGTARVWPEILSIGSLKDIRPAEVAEAELQADEERAGRAG